MYSNAVCIFPRVHRQTFTKKRTVHNLWDVCEQIRLAQRKQCSIEKLKVGFPLLGKTERSQTCSQKLHTSFPRTTSCRTYFPVAGHLADVAYRDQVACAVIVRVAFNHAVG